MIVRDPKGNIRLMCKGADTVIYERLEDTSKEYAQFLLQQLENFATEGLRTLCVAVTDLQKNEYEQWKGIYHKATCSLQNREGKVRSGLGGFRLGLGCVR